MTIEEKIEILNFYSRKNKSSDFNNANLARTIAEIYKKANKINFKLAIELCDKILCTSAKINMSRIADKAEDDKNIKQGVLYSFAPRIVQFDASEKDFQTIELLKRKIAQMQIDINLEK